MSNEPKTVEPVPVQLTRIEGTVNLIAYQMAEVKTTVEALGVRVTTLEHAQLTQAGGPAFLKAWLPTIIAALGVAAAYGFGVKFGG